MIEDCLKAHPRMGGQMMMLPKLYQTECKHAAADACRAARRRRIGNLDQRLPRLEMYLQY